MACWEARVRSLEVLGWCGGGGPLRGPVVILLVTGGTASGSRHAPAGMAAVFVKWAREFFFMSGMIFLVRRWSGNQTDALG